MRLENTRIIRRSVFLALLVVFGSAARIKAQGLPEIPVQSSSALPPTVLPPTASDTKIHQPGPLPDRIILTWTADPTHSQAVTWRTDTACLQGMAEITLAEGGPLFEKKVLRVEATTQKLETDINSAHFHTVNFLGLQPDSKYVYRVGDSVNWSEWIHFRTASRHPQPFSFIYFGDAQTNIRQHWSRVIREAYSDAPKARFLLHAGDLVNNSRRDAEWGEWFMAGGWMNAMVPSVPVVGNHEYSSDPTDLAQSSKICPHWRAQFALPSSGVQGLDETAYCFDYQGARIICLNSIERQSAQVEWLEQRLSENPQAWTIVAFHHPIFSAAKSRDNPRLRSEWKPLFDKYRVDLVLTGHDHTYARSGLITQNVPTGVQARSEEGGTVYVVSVSGPKMYDIEKRPEMMRVAEDVQLYQIIHIDGNQLRYEARTAMGSVYDGFTLHKRPGTINELEEQIPPTPESRRPPAPPAIK